ncbi:MAG: hypothetical protein Q8L49_14890 [Burkholderiaceae bacterium]|nr:hypothetical protein [Burkholderiaceae bacterium]
MNLDRLRSLLQRHRIAVALCLALLLPCGLSAATAHLLSHVGTAVDSQSSGGGGGAGFDDARCDLCLLATAIGTLAPVSARPAPGPADAVSSRPQAAGHAGMRIAPRLAYRSRAPPLAPR